MTIQPCRCWSKPPVPNSSSIRSRRLPIKLRRLQLKRFRIARIDAPWRPTKVTQKNQTTLRVAGRDVSLSNLDKVMYTAVGFTKGQVIDYYTRVARYILPHLKDRPITMKRFPNGIDGQYFYEKNAPSFTPDWI